MGKTEILGVLFDDVGLNEAAVKALDTALSGKGYIVTPNPEIVWLCRKNEKAKRAVNKASLVVPDGIGVVYASRILKRPLAERVPGFDLATALLPLLVEKGLSLFLLGAKPGIAEKAAEKIKADVPGINIAGTNDGYFKDSGPVIDKINASKADVVFVCMGAPYQELWMEENLPKTNAKLMMGLGGSLDVFAGEVNRAPDVWIKLNLEWLYRALTQPSRAKRLLMLPEFLLAAFAERVKGGK
jgi:N-acetylglucosaminyldiphosphoundecaprenol N-acetyl-beta-D-mannosaminyltransferase